MHARRIALTFLIIIPILMSTSIATIHHARNTNSGNSDLDSGVSSLLDGNEKAKKNTYAPSQEIQTGVLNPLTMTQRGYQETSPVRARTDTGKNTKQNITVDEADDWSAARTEIEVSNLKKLYAVNGTFDDEVEPWTGSTYDPSGGNQVQSAAWNSSEGYVTCINYGKFTDKPVQDDTYTHYQGTEILWEQTIANTPQTNSFSLSFRYRYVSGPVDTEPYDFSGDVELRIYVHTDTYYMSIATGDLRGVWYSITDYAIELTGAPVSFTVGIGIYVEYADLVLTANGDYDDDGFPDGLVNAEKIEVNLDDFEFKSQTPVPYQSVGMMFNVESAANPITGTTGSIGTATISNQSLWSVDPLQIEVTANTTVTFDYFVTTYFERRINSSWTTDLSKHGLTFSVNAGRTTELEMYTYVTTSTDYQNYTLSIAFPKDWENATVLDPLNNDITGLCTISAGNIYVPNSLFSRVGWWKLTYQALNYAKNVSIQVQDSYSGVWTENSLFRTSNTTRAQVEIGTASVVPEVGAPVNIRWVMPNGTEWASDSITSLVDGEVNSSSWMLGGANTTAGEWSVEVFWNNGTEIAYQVVYFDLYHQAAAVVKYPAIETDYGMILSNQITLTDSDTGHYLLDDSVSMSANWSDTTVVFTQNFAKNWWQAEFDTALLENGFFTVVVEIVRPYFDPITTQFTVTSVFQTSLEILNAGSIPIERNLNSVFTVQLRYELWNGTGIAGATPGVSYTGPEHGIQWNSFFDSEDGSYSIDITSNISSLYEITISLSKPYHYNSSDSFILVINKTDTELELLNGTADVVQFGDSYRLVVEYRNSTGFGLSDAEVQVLTVTPVTGLNYTNFTPFAQGYYEIVFTPSMTGTFSIVISASLFNHEPQYVTFALTDIVVPSILTSLPSSIVITVNQSYTLQLNFHDEHLNPINAATITALDPPSGVTISSAVPAGSGLYNITIRSAEIDIYSLVFRASATNYQSAIVGFTASVTALPADLEILNAGSIPIENGLRETFTVQLEYTLTNGTGVSEAFLAFVYSGPTNGLLQSNFIDNENGLYSLDIICNVSGTYAITITLSKPYFYSGTDSFTLIIGKTGSELELLNGTADVVLFGESYRLVVEYRNSTGWGLPSADLEIITITPSVGLTHTGFTPVYGGYYEILLTPVSAGTFSLVISASLLNHETQYTTFTLTASGIPTILTSLPSSTTIAINETFILQLRFQDESFNTIDAASISLINLPPGLVISSAVPAGSGLYNVSIQALQISTFDLLFRASKNNYQSSSAGFTLVVTEIQTSLRFAEDVTSTTIPFSETYELIVYYERINPNGAVQGANITIQSSDLTDLVIHVTEYSGYYAVSIKGFAIDSWILSVVAEKADHHTAIKQFRIEVVKIDTNGGGYSPFGALLIGRSYIFNFSYIFKTNSSFIHGATITGTDEGADWVSYLELISGLYQVNLTPQGLGNHYVTLTFEKIGFETWSSRLSFTVIRVPIAVQVMDGLSAPELSESTVLVRLYEMDTGQPVSGAYVRCSVIGPDEVPESYIMSETSTTGVYSAVILMPQAEGVYRLNITCEAANYVLNTAFSTQLQPTRDVMTILIVATTRYYPVMLILAAVGVGLMYRRSARRRRVRENKAALAVKRRFDDVKSLLGVIVLHKESGLPVYSKILREGLEETVISAFITAITSFRGEFDIESTSEEWGLIPISDIVRVVSTNKLVCAFITTGNPSPEQRERMIQFAKTVGFIFDESMSDIPIVVLDQHTRLQFDSLFEDILDGALLRTYKLDEEKKLPTKTCAFERIARKQGVEFKLEELASELAGCGLEEGRVYKAIMTALENHFLVTSDESPFTSEIIRAPEEVSDES